MNIINKIINKAEKFFKTDIKYLLKGSFWLVIGKIVSMIAAFAIMIAFSNLISKETYGNYKYILSITSILTIFTLPGMSVAFIRATTKKKGTTLKACIKEKSKWSLIGVLGCLGVSFWYFFNQNILLGKSLLVASFLFPIPRITNLFLRYWIGKKNFKAYSRYYIIINILEVLFFIPVLFFTNNLVLIILAYFLSRSIFRSLALKKTLKNIKEDKKDKETLSLGKHITLMKTIKKTVDQLDKIIIWHFLGPVQVAIYSFAKIPITKIEKIIDPTHLILPKLSERKIENIKKELINKFLKSFIFFLPFTLLIIFTIPFLFKSIFPQYLNSIPYAQVLCLSFLLTPFSLIHDSFTANAKIKELYLFRIADPLLKVTLFIVLIPTFQVWGIIFSILLNKLIIGLFKFYLFQTTFKEKVA